MLRMLWKWFVITIAVLLVSLLPGITVDSFWSALLVAAIVGILSLICNPIVVMLTFPFRLIINGLLLYLVSIMIPGFTINNFWWALLGSMIMAIIITVLTGQWQKR
jgi:putative membrane protein